jgi:hypothetical protein
MEVTESNIQLLLHGKVQENFEDFYSIRNQEHLYEIGPLLALSGSLVYLNNYSALEITKRNEAIIDVFVHLCLFGYRDFYRVSLSELMMMDHDLEDKHMPECMCDAIDLIGAHVSMLSSLVLRSHLHHTDWDEYRGKRNHYLRVIIFALDLCAKINNGTDDISACQLTTNHYGKLWK